MSQSRQGRRSNYPCFQVARAAPYVTVGHEFQNLAVVALKIKTVLLRARSQFSKVMTDVLQFFCGYAVKPKNRFKIQFDGVIVEKGCRSLHMRRPQPLFMDQIGRYVIRRREIIVAKCRVAVHVVNLVKPKGFDGSEVERYFREGKIKEIADYCETDVINAYRVWLRYELFRGTLSQGAFEASERNLAGFPNKRSNIKGRMYGMPSGSF
jgi:hypothetical protein